jgi:hypothetical protein
MNVTLGSSSDCWDRGPLEFRVTMEYAGTTYTTYYHCREVSGAWYQIFQGVNNQKQYETSMWWNTEEYPDNVTISINDTVVFEHSGILNETNTSIDLNTTEIESYLTENKTIPIVFGSEQYGILEILNVTLYFEDFWKCNSTNGGIQSYNFTIKDENNSTELTGDISVDITYLDKSLSFEEENTSSVAICIGGGTNYSVNGTVFSDVAYVNDYYLRNALFSTNTQYITLYNFADTTGKSVLEFYIKDYSWSPYENIINHMQRYYPVEHTWKTVQQDESGHFGRTIFHVLEENTDYRFRLYNQDNELMKSIGEVKFVCTDNVCEVTTQISYEEGVEVDINPTYTYNNDTGIVQVNWSDPTGATSSVRVLLYKETMTGSILICNHTVNSASGSYDCNASGYTGLGDLYIMSSSSAESIKKHAPIYFNAGEYIGNFLDIPEQSIWAIGFSLTIASLGFIGSPMGVVVMTLFSLIIIMFMGFLKSTVTLLFVGSAFVIGIIIAVIKRDKYG